MVPRVLLWAPEQAWGKVFSAFKFWPFKTKMVKGTLCFIIKCYNKPLRLGTANTCHLCPERFWLKGGLQETLGWNPALGHSTALLPCAPGHCQSVFLDRAPYNTKRCVRAVFCQCCLGRMAIPWRVREWHFLCFGLKNVICCLKLRICGALILHDRLSFFDQEAGVHSSEKVKLPPSCSGCL